MSGPQRARVSSQHDPLPSAIIEILHGKRPCRAAGTIDGHEIGIKPHRAAPFPQPPVEFIILIATEEGIVSARRLQHFATERAQIDRVHGALGPTDPVAGAARSKPGTHRDRHRPFKERGPDRPLPATHVRRPGSLQRFDRTAQVAGW